MKDLARTIAQLEDSLRLKHVPDKYYVVIWGETGKHSRGDAAVEGPYDTLKEARQHILERMIGEADDWIVDNGQVICDAGVLVDADEPVHAVGIVKMCDETVTNIDRFRKMFNDKKTKMQAKADERAERAELERLKDKYE